MRGREGGGQRRIEGVWGGQQGVRGEGIEGGGVDGGGLTGGFMYCIYFQIIANYSDDDKCENRKICTCFKLADSQILL